MTIREDEAIINPDNLGLITSVSIDGCVEFGSVFSTVIPSELITRRDTELDAFADKWEDSFYIEFFPGVFEAIGIFDRSKLGLNLIEPIYQDILKARDSVKELFNPRYEEFIYRDEFSCFPERVHQLRIKYTLYEGIDLANASIRIQKNLKTIKTVAIVSEGLFLADVQNEKPIYSRLP